MVGNDNNRTDYFTSKRKESLGSRLVKLTDCCSASALCLASVLCLLCLLCLASVVLSSSESLSPIVASSCVCVCVYVKKNKTSNFL